MAGPVFIDGVPNLIRVVDERSATPKPLADVSADIRKILAPLQLRAAVRKASDEIVAASEIIYIAE